MQFIDNKIFIISDFQVYDFYFIFTNDIIICQNVKYIISEDDFVIEGEECDAIITLILDLIFHTDKYVYDQRLVYDFLQVEHIFDVYHQISKMKNINKKYNEKLFQYYNLKRISYIDSDYKIPFFNYDKINNNLYLIRYDIYFDNNKICTYEQAFEDDPRIINIIDEKISSYIINIMKKIYLEKHLIIYKVFHYVNLCKLIGEINNEKLFEFLDFIIFSEFTDEFLTGIENIILEAGIIPNFSFMDCSLTMREKILNNIYKVINEKEDINFTFDIINDKNNFTVLKSQLLTMS